MFVNFSVSYIVVIISIIILINNVALRCADKED